MSALRVVNATEAAVFVKGHGVVPGRGQATIAADVARPYIEDGLLAEQKEIREQARQEKADQEREG